MNDIVNDNREFIKRRTRIEARKFEPDDIGLALMQKEAAGYEYAVIYRLDRVDFVRCDEIEDLDKLLEIRAFNKDGEFRAFKAGCKFIGRKRTDYQANSNGEGTITDTLDEYHLLWGSHEAGVNLPRKTVLTEYRGTKLTVPVTSSVDDRVIVTVRNYLNPNKAVFEFDDFRLVDIFAKKVKEYARQ